jgi:hypothetical protein
MAHLCFRREGTAVLIANIGLTAHPTNLEASLLLVSAGFTVFPAAQPEAIPTWFRPLVHDRPSTRALARVHRRRFQTDYYPSGQGFCIPVSPR